MKKAWTYLVLFSMLAAWLIPMASAVSPGNAAEAVEESYLLDDFDDAVWQQYSVDLIGGNWWNRVSPLSDLSYFGKKSGAIAWNASAGSGGTGGLVITPDWSGAAEDGPVMQMGIFAVSGTNRYASDSDGAVRRDEILEKWKTAKDLRFYMDNRTGQDAWVSFGLTVTQGATTFPLAISYGAYLLDEAGNKTVPNFAVLGNRFLIVPPDYQGYVVVPSTVSMDGMDPSCGMTVDSFYLDTVKNAGITSGSMMELAASISNFQLDIRCMQGLGVANPDKTLVLDDFSLSMVDGYGMAQPELLGDLNGDRIVDAQDLMEMKAGILEQRLWDSGSMKNGDINGDMTLDVRDLVLLKKTLAGLMQLNVKEYLSYQPDTWLAPIWEGNVMYNETLMFVEDSDGSLPDAPLLYEPLRILSVRSFDLKEEYTAGVDYTVVNGQIRLTENSRIPRWKYQDYYPAQGEIECTKGGYLAYGEYDTFFKTQVAVTYLHNDVWRGVKPAYAGSVLPHTIQKLKNKEPLRIVFYGDSVVEGCNASSKYGAAPYTPMWTDMTAQELGRAYGTNAITYVNTAVGGKDAFWGLENVEERVNAYNPDLVFLRFGPNDAYFGVTKAEFKDRLQQMINKVRAKNPSAEFILVSPMQSNLEAKGFGANEDQFDQAVMELADENTGCASVPIYQMQQTLQSRKRYYDFTGNNVNHPNDFFIRLHTQVICSLLIENR